MNPAKQFTSIGGQAVIEGVMMRSPHFIAVAVRKPNQRIVIRSLPYRSISARFPILKKPLLRGVVMLIESMVQGVNALSYSANVAAEDPEKETVSSGASGPTSGTAAQEEEAPPELSSWAVASSIGMALVLGLGLFVALPHFLTVMLTSHSGLAGMHIDAQSPWFHLLDGALKMIILLSYVYLIAMMKDVHRVFQYHGAEHKSIYAFEAGEELSVANARRHTTLHPRCGTSFLLFLVLISILVFSFVFPVFHLTALSPRPLVNHTLMILIKILLMLPVSGLAYEFIKMCACRMDNPIFRAAVWPGMILQKLTTREPDDEQLEIALASLRKVLILEKAPAAEGVAIASHEIAALSELIPVAASVLEFPEA